MDRDQETGMKYHIECYRASFYFLLVLISVYIFSIARLKQVLVTEEQSSTRNKKFHHIILGPTAGQGIPNRLQCEGQRALNIVPRKDLAESEGIADITFVTFYSTQDPCQHSDLTNRASDMVSYHGSALPMKERHLLVLHTFINFLKVAMPRSKVVILTDTSSKLSMNRSNVVVYPVQGEFSRNKLMMLRISSYINFLERRLKEISQGTDLGNHYVLIDSDVAVVDNLEHIFQDYPDFHLSLTFRNNKKQPLNSGFIAIRGTREAILRAKIFLQDVLKTYRDNFTSASRMMGDQLALASVVRSRFGIDLRNFARKLAFQEDANGTSVLFLPCLKYNWTPPEGAGQFQGMPLDVKVIHFKGSRKYLMLEAWKSLSHGANISDVLCLILSSGRTKYDF